MIQIQRNLFYCCVHITLPVKYNLTPSFNRTLSHWLRNTIPTQFCDGIKSQSHHHQIEKLRLNPPELKEAEIVLFSYALLQCRFTRRGTERLSSPLSPVRNVVRCILLFRERQRQRARKRAKGREGRATYGRKEGRVSSDGPLQSSGIFERKVLTRIIDGDTM